MNYTNAQIGKKLADELSKGYDIVRISRWAYSFFFNNVRELNPTQKDILEELARMEDDPQFEYTQKELELLAEKLIHNETDPLKQINNK